MSSREPAVVMVITGSIAAYKALEVIRILRKAQVKVYPVMTHHAKKFVTTLSVSVLAEHKVYTSFADLEEGYGMGHIELTRAADLVVVCPASADILASCAGGFAGSLATSLLLASNQPICMFPAMNPTMWAHQAVVANVVLLRKRGVTIMEPEWGVTACNEEGVGRLPDPATIATSILGTLALRATPRSRQLVGKRVLITAGPTREALDPVRYLANRSTGKQGYALASEASKRGAKVILVSGPTAMARPSANIEYIEVENAMEMLQACEGVLPVDVVIGCAAVCDWRFTSVAEQKIAKDEVSWDFVATPDVIAHLAGSGGFERPNLVVGFSAETGEKEEMIQRACLKMVKKGCDWMVVNEVKSAMGAEDNEITLLMSEKEREDWPKMSKQVLAGNLMEKIAETICTVDAT